MFKFIKNLLGKEDIPNSTIEHSSKGNYTQYNKLKSGGHGQEAIDYMDKNGIRYNINKTYSNGVRIGNVPDCKNSRKKAGNNQCWFPKNWDRQTIKKAGQKVAIGKKYSDGKSKEGVHKKVVVAIKRRKGVIVTIYPVQSQKLSKKKRDKKQ